jgi:hypothetical protein
LPHGPATAVTVEACAGHFHGSSPIALIDGVQRRHQPCLVGYVPKGIVITQIKFSLNDGVGLQI